MKTDRQKISSPYGSLPRGVNHESGSIELIMFVLILAGVVFLMFNYRGLRLESRSTEISIKAAQTDAHLTNLAAISYLHASLEDGPTTPAILTVTNNKISGNGNYLISSNGGAAYFMSIPFNAANRSQVGRLFSGDPSADLLSSSNMTKLVVLETIATSGHSKTFVVEATTTLTLADKKLYPIKTIGRVAIVDVTSQGGQYEGTDCASCWATADALTKIVGYKANPNVTRNFGFYKVKASANLCDIHFLQFAGQFIEDHDGTTSVLKTQVAVYCPCDCDWKKEAAVAAAAAAALPPPAPPAPPVAPPLPGP